MSVHQTPTGAMTIQVPEHLSTTLNLTRIPDGLAIAPDQIDVERGKRAVSILQAARNLMVANFPLLTQEEWVQFLTVADYTTRPDRAMMWNIATQPRERSFRLNEIYQYHGKKTYDGLDIARLKTIGPNETFAILLVSDHFWAKSTPGAVDLREILSTVSGRPKECVFVDDPTVEELWKVAKIDFSGETEGKVTFTYADKEMAMLEFRVSEDKNTVTLGTLSCAENRPLVLPEHDLTSTLSKIAIHEVFAALS